MGSVFNSKGLCVSPDTAASVGTTYAAAKFLSVRLPGEANLGPGGGYIKAATIHALSFKVSSIVSATKLYVRLFADAAGDTDLVAEGEGTIMLGVTTSTSGMVVLHGTDFQSVFPCAEDGTIYIGVKTDAGTVSVDFAAIAVSK